MIARSHKIMEVKTVCQRVKHKFTLTIPGGTELFSHPPLLSCTFFLPGAKHSLRGCFSGWKWTGSCLNPNPPPHGSFTADCKFTCHPECRNLIQLDCGRQEGPSQDGPSPESTLPPIFSQVGSKAQGPAWEQLLLVSSAPLSLPRSSGQWEVA